MKSRKIRWMGPYTKLGGRTKKRNEKSEVDVDVNMGVSGFFSLRTV